MDLSDLQAHIKVICLHTPDVPAHCTDGIPMPIHHDLMNVCEIAKDDIYWGPEPNSYNWLDKCHVETQAYLVNEHLIDFPHHLDTNASPG